MKTKFNEFLYESDLIGKRVQLIKMYNDPDPIEPGEEGTIDRIDSTGTLFVKWDNGRSLGLVPEEDRYIILNEGKKKFEDIDDWFDEVASYLETDYEIPTHDEILDTFMNIVNDELEDLFNHGVSPSDAAGTVAANEDALEELSTLMGDEENIDEDDD